MGVRRSGDTGTSELLANPSFETDANGDGHPDNWTANPGFTRASADTFGGSYTGSHHATNNSSQTIQHRVLGIKAAATYSLSGGVEILPTSDTFNYKVQLRRRSSTASLRTDTVKTFTATTQPWVSFNAAKTAPAGASAVDVLLVASSLNGTIYVGWLSISLPGPLSCNRSG